MFQIFNKVGQVETTTTIATPATQAEAETASQAIEGNRNNTAPLTARGFRWAFNLCKTLLTKADVSLENVDNTSDANKPVSTAQQTALNLKVDKVTGKQLSTEDYTTAEKNKLATLSEHFKGVHVSLAALQTAHPTGLSGDYAYVDTGVGSDAKTYIWDINDAAWVLSSGGGTTSDATELVKGIAELATQAETNAGTDDARIVTPLKVAGWWTNVKTLIQTFAAQVTFTAAPKFNSTTASQYLKVDANKDLTSVSSIPASDVTSLPYDISSFQHTGATTYSGWYGSFSVVSNPGTVVMSKDQLIATPFVVSKQRTLDEIVCEVTAAGSAASVIRMGIYSDNGNVYPGALLLDAGTVTGDTVAVKTIAISQVIQPGLYWLAIFHNSAANITVRCLSATAGGTPTVMGIVKTAIINAAPNRILATLVYTTLPANYPTASVTISNSTIPMILVHASA